MSRDPQFGQDALPRELRDAVVGGQPSRMRFELRGEMHLAVGDPDPVGAASPTSRSSRSSDLEDTLERARREPARRVARHHPRRRRRRLVGQPPGAAAARRACRPPPRRSPAGRLDTRLESSDDPDLRPIAESFNDMAQALQDRIERDARFASDVSHELRSPLMTLAASIEVMENQRDELPERSRAALDLMVADIDRFQQLVEDLLEISRFDAGVVRLELEEVHLAELVMQAVSHSTDADVPVDLDAELAGVVVQADKRRLVRVIANLLDNAAKYGGGATSVSLRQVDDGVQIAVEDRGPGVPEEDRDLIFDRFSRGRRRRPARQQRRRRPRPGAGGRAREPARRPGVGRGPRRRRRGRPLRRRAAGGGARVRRVAAIVRGRRSPRSSPLVARWARCGVPADGGPQAIADRDLPADLARPEPRSSTTLPESAGTTTVDVYLLEEPPTGCASSPSTVRSPRPTCPTNGWPRSSRAPTEAESEDGHHQRHPRRHRCCSTSPRTTRAAR